MLLLLLLEYISNVDTFPISRFLKPPHVYSHHKAPVHRCGRVSLSDATQRVGEGESRGRLRLFFKNALRH
jgi:hypothetical protein